MPYSNSWNPNNESVNTMDKQSDSPQFSSPREREQFFRMLRFRLRTPIHHMAGFCDIALETIRDKQLTLDTQLLQQIDEYSGQLLPTLENFLGNDNIASEQRPEFHSWHQQLLALIEQIYQHCLTLLADEKLQQQRFIYQDIQKIRRSAEELKTELQAPANIEALASLRL